MNNRAAVGTALISIVLTVVLMLCCAGAHDSFALTPHQGWRPVIHAWSNAWFPWYGLPLAFDIHPLLLLSLIGTAGYPLLFVLLGRRYVWWSGAILPSLILLFGQDTSLLAAFSLFPWVSSALIVFTRHSTVWMIVSGLFILTLPYLLAGMTGLVFTIAALVLQSTQRAQPVITNRRFRGATALVLLAVVVQILVVPTVPLPDYPPSARLHRLDDATDFSRPLLGATTPLKIIDRTEEKRALLLPVLTIGGTSAVLALLHRSSLSPLILGLAAAVVFDVTTTEQIATAGPLQALRRLLPGLFLHAPTAFLLAMLLPLSLLASCWAKPSWPAITMLLVTVATSLAGLLSSSYQLLEIDPSILASPQGLSPSYGVIRQTPPVVHPFARESSHSSFAPPPRLSASHNRDLIPQLTNGHSPKRWFVTAQESQGAWLQATLDAPATIVGIRLSARQFPTDFPGAIEISYGNNCSTNRPDLALTPWEGPVLLTDQGFPYYGPPERVEVHLPPKHGTCLRITNTKSRPPYDWSVSSLEILTAPLG